VSVRAVARVESWSSPLVAVRKMETAARVHCEAWSWTFRAMVGFQQRLPSHRAGLVSVVHQSQQSVIHHSALPRRGFG
jgi:hypothetical protein